MLCLKPAIQYAVFNRLKAITLAYRSGKGGWSAPKELTAVQVRCYCFFVVGGCCRSLLYLLWLAVVVVVVVVVFVVVVVVVVVSISPTAVTWALSVVVVLSVFFKSNPLRPRSRPPAEPNRPRPPAAVLVFGCNPRRS